MLVKLASLGHFTSKEIFTRKESESRDLY